MLSFKQGGIKYHFLSLWYDDLGLKPDLSAHCRTLGQYIVDNVYTAIIKVEVPVV